MEKNKINYGIYKLTSPSGKCYIGQSLNLEKRFKQYKHKACKNQNFLYNALVKYGWENFKVDILWSTTDDTNIVDILNDMEKDFIYLYDSIAPNGYNLRSGGDFYELSQETKDKISKSKIGKKMSDEAKLNMSIGKIGVARKEFTDITIKKMSKPKTKEHSENISKGKKKVVLQYDLDGNFIKEWSCLNDTQSIGGFNCTSVGNVCRGNQKTSGGYIWQYKKK